MFGDVKSLNVQIHYSEENIEKLIIDNVPEDITSAQLLQRIFPLIKDNNRNNRESSSEFDYCLQVNGKILLDTDTVESTEVDVIPKPKEIANLANLCIIMAFMFMVLMPAYILIQFGSVTFSIKVFIISAFLLSRVIKLFPSKTDYTSYSFTFKNTKTHPILEPFVILVKSFHPDFHLEDVLIHD